MMLKILNYIIDFIFPPNPYEIEIREIKKEDVYTRFSFKNELNTSIYPYKEPLIREIVWQIKYKKNKKAIEIAGYSIYLELIKLNQPLLLIPIPISKIRMKERGYNQCELIIDEIIKLDAKNLFHKNYNLLVREVHIDKQTHKNRKERLNNTKNIFGIRGETDRNQRIVIIDDVTTTGSTLSEARRCLEQAGYHNISTLTLAH